VTFELAVAAGKEVMNNLGPKKSIRRNDFQGETLTIRISPQKRLSCTKGSADGQLNKKRKFFLKDGSTL
jgi:hypothetical protein